MLSTLKLKASSSEDINEALNEALTDNQKMLFDILRNNSTITQKEIIEQTSLSRSTVQRAVKELSETGRMERVGSKKTGSWIVKENMLFGISVVQVWNDGDFLYYEFRNPVLQFI